jgi:hypothetical protein
MWAQMFIAKYDDMFYDDPSALTLAHVRAALEGTE